MQANLFELSNASVKINYSSSSLDGKPQLNYTKGNLKRNFRGKEIRQQTTEIGTLLTVTLEAQPDRKTTLFSLVLPQVNVPEGASQMAVSVKALETVVRTSIAGPGLVKGQVQTYKVLSLKGYAKSVLF